MNRITLVCGACILAVAVGAFAIRLPRLAFRPMHPDEANQAYKTGQLLDSGAYAYDPVAHHGPTLYYLTLPALWLSGARDYADSDEFPYRIVPVVFGAAVILLLMAVGRDIGWPAAIVAAVLAAISSAMVYYSRDYIQETLLVFFTFGAIVSAWRYVRGGSGSWAVIAGLFFGLMYATKETWVLSAVAMVGGLALWAVWTRILERHWPHLMLPRCAVDSPSGSAVDSPSGSAVGLRTHRAESGDDVSPQGLAAGAETRRATSSETRRAAFGPLVLAALVAVATIVAFYSSFGRNWAGPWDSVAAYANYLGQATGDKVHIHPWYYYLSLLVYQHPAAGFTWSEGLIVGLAVVGIVAALAGKGLGRAHLGLVRFLAFYTILLTVLYSAIPYKTPWCVLSFLQAMTVMAGVGAVALVRLVRLVPLQLAVAAGLAFLAVNLAQQSYRLNFDFDHNLPSDLRNPYVYAQTSPNILNLTALVGRLAAASPDGRRINIQVIDENYWPLPWYLRQYPNVGYRQEVPAVPRGFSADVVIFSPDLQADLEKSLDPVFRETCNKQALFGLRNGFNVRMYVDKDLWQAMLARPVARPGGAEP